MPFDDDDHDLAAPATHAETGFPEFRHNQWTVEGEIERLGAFGRSGARVRGWKRIVVVLLAVMLVAPLVIGVVVNIWSALR